MRALRILFVDDEEKIVQLLSDSLSLEGHHVTGMSDALKALSYFWQHHQQYDLLITDHLMPGLLGTQLVAQIKEKLPLFPIILVTGNSPDDIEHRLDGTQNQNFCVLQKPFQKKELHSKIHQVLTSKNDTFDERS